jgi:hypothetical protein
VVTPKTATKGPASAGPLRVLLAVALVAVLAPGCRRGGGEDAKTKTDERGLPRGLSAKPEPLDPSLPGADGSSTTVPGGTGTTVRGGGTGTTATTRSGGGPAPAAPFRQLAAATDGTGDHGLGGKPYADLTAVRVEDDGTSARLSVEVAGAVPSPLPEGETMGVGIDLYRAGAESDYQVFADGGSDGWRAYFQDHEVFKPFPGRFELGGNRLVFVVPWSALGGRTSGAVAAFADWTKNDLVVVASTTQDKVPDRGHTPFTV